MWTKIKQSLLCKKDKSLQILIAVGILGILIILFSSDNPQETEQKSAESPTTTSYVEDLEQRLTTLISSVDNVGKAKVMVTLENGIEYVFASEDKQSIDTDEDNKGENGKRVSQKNVTEEKIVIVDTSYGTRQALVKTSKEPTVKGVVVVCEGGDKISVQQEVTDLVTTALDIGANKVCVSKLKSNR